jgi:hypothetical protein
MYITNTSYDQPSNTLTEVDLNCNESIKYNLYSLNEPITILIYSLWSNTIYYIVETDNHDDSNNICILEITCEVIANNLICINQNDKSCNFFIYDDEMKKLERLYKLYHTKHRYFY